MTTKRSTPQRGAPKYAEIAPAIPLPGGGAATYTYRVPDPELPPPLFSRARISFGKRLVTGVVVGLHSRRLPYPAKPLELLSPTQLTAHQVAFARWIATTMQGGLGYTLRLFYPPGRIAEEVRTTPTAPPPNATIPPVITKLSQELETSDVAYLEARRLARWKVLHALARHYASRQKQLLVLMPEKWMVDQFLAALPATESPYWLGMQGDSSTREQSRVWQRVRDGQVTALVGTQKALFLPWQQLGAVVIEEEFLSTHKLWDQYPRLDNRYAARELARLHETHILYATSVPSISLEHELQNNRVRLAHDRRLPLKLKVIAKTYTDRAEHRLLPAEFVSLLNRWLVAQENVLVLHNARGTWQTAVCRKCHQAVRCEQCGVALTIHGSKKSAKLKCHHCDRTYSWPDVCPLCHKGKLTGFGAGTERIEDIIKAVVPAGVSLTRIDADTTPVIAKKRPRRRKAGEIVMGTSALFGQVKDRSFDRVVYLFPERGLLYPDYRSEERTLMFLIRLQQLSAGRTVTVVTAKKGLVAATIARPLPAFYAGQLKERKRLGYPPFTDSVVVTIKSKSVSTATKKAQTIRTRIEERMADSTLSSAVTVRGPYTSFVKQRRGYAEVHLLLLGKLDTLVPLYAGLPVDFVDVAPARIL